MRVAIWIVAVAVLAGYVALAIVTVERGTDQARIDALVARGVTATQNRDLSGLVSCLSRDYRDEAGLNYDRLRVILAQSLRSEASYTVATRDQTCDLQGDKATVKIHVTLTHPGGVFYDRDLTIMLAQENVRHMMIVPVKAWKVVGSQNLGFECP